MRRNLIPSLIALLALGGGTTSVYAADPAVSPAPAAVAGIDATLPESAILLPAKVLRGNDFKAFFKTLPAEDRAKAENDWKETQVKAKSGKPMDLTQVNETLAKLLDPNAVDMMFKEIEPKLAEIKPEEIAQQMQMGAAFIPMMFSQPSPGQTPEQTKNKQMLGAMLSGIMTDASTWVPTAGLNDPLKLRRALEHLVDGAKSLGVKNIEELQALPFEEFLGRVGPLVKKAKAAAGVYDIQIDAFLDSIKAVPAAAPAAVSPDDKSLTMTCTIFGKPYSIPVLVTKKDGHWIVSPKNGEAFGAMQKMMGGGAPAGDAPDEMPPMP